VQRQAKEKVAAPVAQAQVDLVKPQIVQQSAAGACTLARGGARDGGKHGRPGVTRVARGAWLEQMQVASKWEL
jgi:hypothetical protein